MARKYDRAKRRERYLKDKANGKIKSPSLQIQNFKQVLKEGENRILKLLEQKKILISRLHAILKDNIKRRMFEFEMQKKPESKTSKTRNEQLMEEMLEKAKKSEINENYLLNNHLFKPRRCGSSRIAKLSVI